MISVAGFPASNRKPNSDSKTKYGTTRKMATKVIRARKGVQLIEDVLMGGAPAAVLSRTYTVKSRHVLELIYTGSDFDAAELAFEKASV